ncbi:MAG: universal stress protein [Rhodocyclaceae bacterium]|nr:universal stress protein [Rhodocyclaceae bacterium]MBX3666891.1 universal stress protein [Rhodocyclaceae bacterium]
MGKCYKTVLLAFDGTDSGRRGLLECANLNGILHAQVHLLAVAPLAVGLYLTEGVLPDSLQEAENRRFREILDEGLAQLAAQGFQAEGHLVTGEPVDEICRLAKTINADLVVVGHRRHQSFLERWWKGSIGQSLLEAAPCSILIAMEKAPQS